MALDTPRQPKPDYPAPEGYAWAIVEDTGPLTWHLATDVEAARMRCRHSTSRPCSNRVVAWLQRGHAPMRHFYCADHMYGRWIEGEKIVCWRPRRVPS